MRATAPDTVGAWSTTSSFTPRFLTPPIMMRLTQAPTRLDLSWEPPDGLATAYEVQVLDWAEQPLAPQPHAVYHGTTARMSATKLQRGTTYGVRIRETAPGLESAWNETGTFVRQQPGPVPEGFPPVIAASPADLVTALFGVRGEHPGVVESFWGRMQTELLDRRSWRTRTELSTEIFDYRRLLQPHQATQRTRHARSHRL